MSKPGTKTRLAEVVQDGHLELSEATADGPRKVIGTVATANKVNRNGRYYSREVYEQAVSSLRDALPTGAFTGELDHPEGKLHGSLWNTAMVFEDLYFDNDDLRFEARLLNTDAGRNLAAMLEGKMRVGMSTRGYASTKRGKVEGKDAVIIQDDYVLVGIDAVKSPSNESGAIRLTEALEETITIPPQAGREDHIMKDVQELRAAHPDLVAEVEAAAKAETEKALNEAQEKLSKLEADLSAEAAAREASDKALAEAQTNLDTIRTAILGEEEGDKTELDESAVNVAVAAMHDTIQKLTDRLNESEAAAEAMKLNAQLREHFDAALAEHQFAAMLREEVDPAKFDSTESLDAEITRLTNVAKRVTEGTNILSAKGKGVVEQKDSQPQPKVENPYLDESMLLYVTDLVGAKESHE